MKTRIKQVVDGFGNTIYYPQVRDWGFWSCLYKRDLYGDYGKIECRSIEEAEDQLNKLVEQRLDKKKRKQKSVSILHVTER